MAGLNVSVPDKPTNPKDSQATNRLPLDLVPATMKILAALAFAEGAAKYGSFNWRRSGVRASVYKAAIERHIESWWNGEECDPLTGVPHLASMLASIGIVADAKLCGNLLDDRPPFAPVGEMIRQSEADVARVREIFKDRTPAHCTEIALPATAK
ncbi:MAG: dATP/dGTP diphosphohydrolase domain-containing protein [Beijerinckiaceae bacterium]